MRHRLLSGVGLLLALVAGIVASDALGQDAKTTAPAPPAASRPAATSAAIDALIVQQLDAQTSALGQARIQQKAIDHITADQAHRQAVLTMRQCQSCHQGLSSSPVAVVDPHGWRLSALPQDTPWIGVSVGPADDVLRSQLKLPDGAGVVVTKVASDSPAQGAGLREHDILLSANDKPVPDGEALATGVQAWKPESKPLTLKLLRAGKQVEASVTPSRQPQEALSYLAVFDNAQEQYRIGVHATAPDETLRKQLLLDDAGLVVTAVEEKTPAANQGVRANDVLLSANGKPLKEPTDLPAVVQQAAITPVELELLRGGVRLKIAVIPEKAPAGTRSAEMVSTFLDLGLATSAPRELAVVQSQDLANATIALGLKGQAAPHSATAERLAEISARLEQLRLSVQALHTELVKEPKPAE